MFWRISGDSGYPRSTPPFPSEPGPEGGPPEVRSDGTRKGGKGTRRDERPIPSLSFLDPFPFGPRDPFNDASDGIWDRTRHRPLWVTHRGPGSKGP